MVITTVKHIGQQDAIERVATSGSRHSAKSRLSKVFSLAAEKDGIERPRLPESDLPNGVVGWDGQDDPAMPFNFAPAKKWFTMGALALITLMTPLSSSILAPAIAYYDAEFHNDNQTTGALPVSIYLLGYAVGPLFLAGMTEIYGRHLVISCANVFFCAWQIACALAPSLGSLIAFRFLTGVGGSACMTIGGAIVGDLFIVEERGLALTVWTLGPLYVLFFSAFYLPSSSPLSCKSGSMERKSGLTLCS